MASHVEDDGFHEIQLNGKQLVFVFMAATVVSVVIFLCGVLVGRGVQSERALAQSTETPAEFKELALDPSRAVIPPTVKPGSDPTLAAPPAPPAGEQAKDRSTPEPLPAAAASNPAGTAASPAGTASNPAGTASNKDARLNPKADDKKPAAAASTPVAEPVDSSKPSAKPAAPRDPAPADAPVKDAPPAGDGSASDWVVQVAATKARGEADTIAKRLGSKGYSAFVLAEGTSMFRVRVGGYKTKREADAIAAKLRKEERIKPWVTQRRAS